MQDIISLISIFSTVLSPTTLRQLSKVVFAILAMTGRVTMLNISRWTPKGGSYRTIQRFFNTVIPWTTMSSIFYQKHLYDKEAVYILAGDETIVSKSGTCTFGLSRFFSSLYGKTVPGLSFLALSLISVKQRRSFPMVIEQIVRKDTSEQDVLQPKKQDDTEKQKRKCGRPKGSRNKNKDIVVLSDTFKQLQTMIMGLLPQIQDKISLTYIVLDGYFGNNNAHQMAKQCGLHLISKLRKDAALFYPSTSYGGRGPRPIYGDRFDPQQIDKKYLIHTEIEGKLKTEVYQIKLRNKKFTNPLNVVVVLKTHLTTRQKSHVLLFSSDLELEALKILDYYSLRFQIEFNFREAKQNWGLEDFMNVNKIPVYNAANLSMFMVLISAKLTDTFQNRKTRWSVLDLKSYFRGQKYLAETLKMLPQKPDPIIIEHIAEHLGTIGCIHHTQPELKPG